MSTMCLLVFLGINGKGLDVAPGELAQMALWLAVQPAERFETVKFVVAEWIRLHLREFDRD